MSGFSSFKLLTIGLAAALVFAPEAASAKPKYKNCHMDSRFRPPMRVCDDPTHTRTSTCSPGEPSGEQTTWSRQGAPTDYRRKPEGEIDQREALEPNQIEHGIRQRNWIVR